MSQPSRPQRNNRGSGPGRGPGGPPPPPPPLWSTMPGGPPPPPPPPMMRSAPVSPTTRPKLGRNSRLSSGLVALGIAASLSVYAVGYTRTQAAATASGGYANALPTPASVQAAVLPPTAPPTSTATATQGPSTGPSAIRQAPPTSTSAASAPGVTSPSSRVQAPPTATVPPVAAATWRDGTYNGLGSSRHGSIGVALVIRGGKIATVTITDCETRYPCRVIAALPGEVVARQSAVVDIVSGATDSSSAFRGAIISALNQARAGG